MKKKQFNDFESVRAFVRTLKLKNQLMWNKYCKSGQKPIDIPANPQVVYKNNFMSWGDFLGTRNISTHKKKYRIFVDARKFVNSLGIKSRRDWNLYCKSGQKPDDIPSYPNQVYKNKGWISMGDWLGSGTVHVRFRKYWPYITAKNYVNKLNLKSAKYWKEYCKSGKKPLFIPSAPDKKYIGYGWTNWGDFLGTNVMATNQRKYLEFADARKIVHSMRLKSGREWKKFTKDPKFPKNIPLAPDQHYKNKGWISMGDWLGSGTIQPQLRDYWPYITAKNYVNKLNLRSNSSWRKFAKSGQKPEYIPANPNTVYKNNGWVNMGEWLGTGSIDPRIISKNYGPFLESREEARLLAKKYKIKNWEDWIKAHRQGKIPKHLPANPWHVYSKTKRKKDGEKTV